MADFAFCEALQRLRSPLPAPPVSFADARAVARRRGRLLLCVFIPEKDIRALNGQDGGPILLRSEPVGALARESFTVFCGDPHFFFKEGGNTANQSPSASSHQSARMQRAAAAEAAQMAATASQSGSALDSRAPATGNLALGGLLGPLLASLGPNSPLSGRNSGTPGASGADLWPVVAVFAAPIAGGQTLLAARSCVSKDTASEEEEDTLLEFLVNALAMGDGALAEAAELHRERELLNEQHSDFRAALAADNGASDLSSAVVSEVPPSSRDSKDEEMVSGPIGSGNDADLYADDESDTSGTGTRSGDVDLVALLGGPLPDEPDADVFGLVQLTLRMPDGSRLLRRFVATDTLGLVRRVVAQSADPPATALSDVRLTANFPTAVFESDEQTLEEAGLCPRGALFVHIDDGEI
jgi:UBX domain